MERLGSVVKKTLAVWFLTIVAIIGSNGQVAVSIPDTNSISGDTVAVPVRVGNLTGLGVLAFQFSAAFNQDVLLPVGIERTGDLSDGPNWTVLCNILHGEMRIGGYGSGELAGEGTLLRLKFIVAGFSGTKTSLTLNPFVFNSGAPEALVTNGSLTVSGATSVSSMGRRAISTSLDQNYPNPFNPTTRISGEWAADSWVRLVVYDVLGREVAILANGRYPAGRFTFAFDGSKLASGIYFYQLTTGAFTATKTMVLGK